MNNNEIEKIENNINQKCETSKIKENSRNNQMENRKINSYDSKKNILNNIIENNNINIINNDNSLANEKTNNINEDNTRNYTTIIDINNQMNKKDYKNKNKNSFLKSSKIVNSKLTIESKDKLNHKTFYNEKNFFSPLKTKKVFSFSNPKKKKQIKLKRHKKTSILYNINQRPPIVDKEGILMEILQSRNQIEYMELELLKTKKKRKRLEQKFLANKLIIETILDIQDENDNVDIKNNTTKNKQFINENSNEKIGPENFKKQEDNKTNNILIPKTETNYCKSQKNFENNPIILCLKKQISNCDKNIEDKNKIMEIKQNENRVNNFLKLNSSIESKNKTLEELINKSQTLQYIILDIETRIEYFAVKIKHYIDEIYKLKDLLNNNNTKKIKIEKDIQSLYAEKDIILKKIKLLEDEEKEVNLKIENKKREKENVENELKITKDIEKEKTYNEKELIEFGRNENLWKRNIEKNNVIINSISNDKKYFEKNIEKYLNEREILIEKSKIPQKTREKLKSLENEIKNIKKEFEENKNYINNHEKIKNQLQQKINKLSIELNSKNEENNKIKEELKEIKNKYKSEIPKQYRKLNTIKLDNENELENNENRDKNKGKKDCIIFWNDDFKEKYKLYI